jgi:hypothetical protein
MAAFKLFGVPVRLASAIDMLLGAVLMLGFAFFEV